MWNCASYVCLRWVGFCLWWGEGRIPRAREFVTSTPAWVCVCVMWFFFCVFVQTPPDRNSFSLFFSLPSYVFVYFENTASAFSYFSLILSAPVWTSHLFSNFWFCFQRKTKELGKTNIQEITYQLFFFQFNTIIFLFVRGVFEYPL